MDTFLVAMLKLVFSPYNLPTFLHFLSVQRHTNHTVPLLNTIDNICLCIDWESLRPIYHQHNCQQTIQSPLVHTDNNIWRRAAKPLAIKVTITQTRKPPEFATSFPTSKSLCTDGSPFILSTSFQSQSSSLSAEPLKTNKVLSSVDRIRLGLAAGCN